MKMRRIALFFLAVCLLLYCVSCGGTDAGREEVTFTESVSSEAAPYTEGTYTQGPDNPNTEEESMNAQKTKLMLEIGGTVLSATLAENSTVEALIKLLKEPLSLDMEDYAGFEKGARRSRKRFRRTTSRWIPTREMSFSIRGDSS